MKILKEKFQYLSKFLYVTTINYGKNEEMLFGIIIFISFMKHQSISTTINNYHKYQQRNFKSNNSYDIAINVIFQVSATKKSK